MISRPLAVFLAVAMLAAGVPLLMDTATAAPTDKTISTNLWLTIGESVGLGDGTSFANRINITSWEDEIGSIVVNHGVSLTIVLEAPHDAWSTYGWIKLGNNAVASKTFTCWGKLLTVDSNNEFNLSVPYSVYISGTTSYREGVIQLNNDLNVVNNVFFGCQPGGSATNNAAQGIKVDGGFYSNCTFKIYYSSSKILIIAI